jgi:glycine/D-amino acid oxidase-like deaminating enzyme
LLGALHARFPQAAGTRFESIWSGATGFTVNGGPLWGRLEPGLFISAGCNGGGVVKGTLFGQAIADRVLDRKTADIPALFGRAGWMPPEPLRRIGFHVISAMERSKGHAEV